MTTQRREGEPQRVSLMTTSTSVFLKDKFEQLQDKRTEIVGGLGGADYTSGLHDDPSMVRDLQFLDTEIERISQTIINTEVLSPREEISSLGIGNLVRLKFTDEEEEETYRLGTTVDVSFSAGNIRWISIESLLGQTLEGRRQGETVYYKPPKLGERLSVKIIEILPENN